MAKRKVDSRGWLTLFRDFAGLMVTIERLDRNELRVRKLQGPVRKYSLAQLVAGITRKNRHAEISTGRSVGLEGERKV
jgi:hypothetical protein